MNPVEDVPQWVPAIIRRLAPKSQVGRIDVRERLLADVRMKDVWNYLSSAPVTWVGSDVPSFALIETWSADDLEASLSDKALFAFFTLSAVRMTIQNEPVFKGKLSASLKEWSRVAELCRMHASGEPLAYSEPQIVLALHTSATYFTALAKVVTEANQDSPNALEKPGKQFETDKLRVQVRALALDTQTLFGSFHLGIVAKVASVALDLNLEKRTIQDWCDDLPRGNQQR